MDAIDSISYFNQAPLLNISGIVICPTHVLQFAEHQFAECRTQRRLLEG